MTDGGLHHQRRPSSRAPRTVRRRDPRVAAFYDRLLAAGKPRKLINIAVARKLLVALNSMLQHHSDWRSSPYLLTQSLDTACYT